MPVIVDPPEAIRQLLYDNWKLHGDLGRDKIDFNTGAVAPSRKYPSIEIVPLRTPTVILTAEWWQRNPLLHLHIWERPRTTEKEGLTKAKTRRHYMVEEAYRILHLKQLLAQDTEWLHPEDEINADQYYAIDEDVRPKDQSSASASQGMFYPVLHTIVPVRMLQFHNMVTGGIQVNR